MFICKIIRCLSDTWKRKLQQRRRHPALAKANSTYVVLYIVSRGNAIASGTQLDVNKLSCTVYELP